MGDFSWNYSVAYEGQQDDVSQSVRGNYKKTRFKGGQILSAVEGNASVLSSASCKSYIRLGDGGVFKGVGTRV